MYCRNCGIEINEKNIICPHCGTRLDDSVEPVKVTPSQPDEWNYKSPNTDSSDYVVYDAEPDPLDELEILKQTSITDEKAKRTTNPSLTAILVLGLCSIVTSGVTGVIAIVNSVKYKRQHNELPKKGVAGLAFGIAGIVFALFNNLCVLLVLLD